MLDALAHPLPLPLLRATPSRALEARLQELVPAHALMERAGLAVARLALAIAPHTPCFWILCGPGNNGGDGLVASRHLHAAGHRVRLSRIDTANRPPADAAWALRQAQAVGVEIGTSLQPPPGTGLVIDALLGLGLSRPLDGWLADAVQAINAQNAPVLAVDLPSGMDGDTGMPVRQADGADGPVVRADHCLSLLSLKPGLFGAQGRDLAGRIWFDALGAGEPDDADAVLIASQQLTDWQTAARRPHSSHKGSRGDVLVIGGAGGMQGAAGLAASAALAAGAGRSHLCSLASEHALLPRLELMHWAIERWGPGTSWQDLTLVCGCGAGHELEPGVSGLLTSVLDGAPRLVLDADALNTLARHPAQLAACASRAARGLHTIATPHPLEAARLLGCELRALQSDRLRSAQALAGRLGCTVILKGSGSVVASPGRRPWVNKSGSGALATPGSGDVLAGWLGGMWAQTPAMDPHALAAAAAHWHGAAAHGAPAPLRAADLIERMHALQRSAD